MAAGREISKGLMKMVQRSTNFLCEGNSSFRFSFPLIVNFIKIPCLSSRLKKNLSFLSLHVYTYFFSIIRMNLNYCDLLNSDSFWGLFTMMMSSKVGNTQFHDTSAHFPLSILNSHFLLQISIVFVKIRTEQIMKGLKSFFNHQGL